MYYSLTGKNNLSSLLVNITCEHKKTRRRNNTTRQHHVGDRADLGQTFL